MTLTKLASRFSPVYLHGSVFTAVFVHNAGRNGAGVNTRMRLPPQTPTPESPRLFNDLCLETRAVVREGEQRNSGVRTLAVL